jgi:Xaa-Pro aminopeptidase
MAGDVVFGPGHSVLVETLADGEADAFVHAVEPGDSVLQYLTGLTATDQSFGIAWVPEDDTYCSVCVAPERVARRCRREYAGQVVETEQPIGRAIADRLAAAGVEGPVLAEPTIPHDVALYLEEAGYELTSTDAIAVARRSKTTEERTEIERAQQAAHAGIERARRYLSHAAATGAGEGDQLCVDGVPVTVERLRQVVDEAIVGAGAAPAGGTRISSGPTMEFARDAVLCSGVPVVVRCAPRTQRGYHGTLARTLVVDSDGGWERRAHVAVTNARQAALAVVRDGPDATIEEIRTEAVAELTAYGFGQMDQQMTVDCHGVGLARYERPTPRYDTTIQAGEVLALELTVAGETGDISLSDLIVVGEDDSQVLVDPPTTLVP